MSHFHDLSFSQVNSRGKRDDGDSGGRVGAQSRLWQRRRQLHGSRLREAFWIRRFVGDDYGWILIIHSIGDHGVGKGWEKSILVGGKNRNLQAKPLIFSLRHPLGTLPSRRKPPASGFGDRGSPPISGRSTPKTNAGGVPSGGSPGRDYGQKYHTVRGSRSEACCLRQLVKHWLGSG